MKFKSLGFYFGFWILCFGLASVWAGTCGNNIIEPGEACDGSDLGGLTCSGIASFKSGSLQCSSDCSGYDVTSCVQGNTIPAASCSQPDVQAAVNSSSDGDTLVIPPGNCNWNTPVTVTDKGLLIEGSGPDTTVIIANNSRLFRFNNSQRPLRLTSLGITGTVPDTAISIDGDYPTLRFDHLRFTDINTRSVIIGYNDQFKSAPAMRGLFDHITYTNTGCAPFALHYGRDNSWESSDDPGSGNAIFYEDNSFSWTPAHDVCGYINDGEHGARFIIRHNSFTNGQLLWHDTGSTPQSRGTRWYEIYDNTFHCTALDCGWSALGFRGGTGVVYNNVIPIYPNGYENPSASEIYRVSYPGGGKPWTFACDGGTERACSDFRSHCNGGDYRSCSGDYDCGGVGDGTCSIDTCTQDSQCGSGNHCLAKFDGQLDSTGWPCRDQAGRGQDDPVTHDQTSSPFYWWNNHDLANKLLKVYIPQVNANFIQENRDYFNEAQRPNYVPYVYPHPLTRVGPLAVTPPAGAGAGATCFGVFTNVFNPAKGKKIIIPFSIAVAGPVALNVYDRRGQLVKTLIDGDRSAGSQPPVEWDGKNNSGSVVSSGSYTLILKTGEAIQIKKIVIVK